ncbi:30S ribosomal protein S4 [Candidatus Nomurabacteria bacterium RIFCSPHIGHO2_02_FULL_33_12]|uniref:Small ribosomal subunit protein uS4 n=1 Tax=Candidatus Nomurabacteria bacterium RIFCSPLOWO2_01_FULL_33_17 TaxID=1801764 RepID=A0A1F6WR23_9BACT|nr:MAG: 30S ribosomal protein S4 [Candidatus Nomurabacteria bacterium RIFCSPHIGHO2_02_FULL_33_12]OGI84195.1 MAG: 30S ribosomal protein S4 [Candidatus Nomurabacteria bacterium RIFCSPLOWO2_01_FULL_33_17]
MKPVKKYKVARRLGAHVFEKTQTAKFADSLNRRSKKSTKRGKPLSGYAEQMYEKQRIRFSYGISEKQFSNYVKVSTNTKGAIPSLLLAAQLESRLDNIVYRLGFAPTRRMARQMTSHGHFCVNGTRTTVPSYSIKQGDVITVREGSKKSIMFADMIAKQKDNSIPPWLTLSIDTLTGNVKGKPGLVDSGFDFNRVIEFYSR